MTQNGLLQRFFGAGSDPAPPARTTPRAFDAQTDAASIESVVEQIALGLNRAGGGGGLSFRLREALERAPATIVTRLVPLLNDAGRGALLNDAVAFGNFALVTAILDAGVDPNTPSHEGAYPLVSAIIHLTDPENMLRLLKSRGADEELAAAQIGPPTIRAAAVAGASPERLSRLAEIGRPLSTSGLEEVIAACGRVTREHRNWSAIRWTCEMLGDSNEEEREPDAHWRVLQLLIGAPPAVFEAAMRAGFRLSIARRGKVGTADSWFEELALAPHATRNLGALFEHDPPAHAMANSTTGRLMRDALRDFTNGTKWQAAMALWRSGARLDTHKAAVTLLRHIVEAKPGPVQTALGQALVRFCRDIVARGEETLGLTAAAIIEEMLAVQERLGGHDHPGAAEVRKDLVPVADFGAPLGRQAGSLMESLIRRNRMDMISEFIGLGRTSFEEPVFAVSGEHERVSLIRLAVLHYGGPQAAKRSALDLLLQSKAATPNAVRRWLLDCPDAPATAKRAMLAIVRRRVPPRRIELPDADDGEPDWATA